MNEEIDSLLTHLELMIEYIEEGNTLKATVTACLAKLLLENVIDMLEKERSSDEL